MLRSALLIAILIVLVGCATRRALKVAGYPQAIDRPDKTGVTVMELLTEHGFHPGILSMSGLSSVHVPEEEAAAACCLLKAEVKAGRIDVAIEERN